MNKKLDPRILQPGDGILYHGKKGSLASIAIAVKTWHWDAVHVEVFDQWVDGVPYTVGSRNGVGVNRYPLNIDNISWVIRPRFEEHYDHVAAIRWFETVARNQKYDWTSIWRFVAFNNQPDADLTRQMCSEYMTRHYRNGGMRPISDREDASKIAPAYYIAAPMFSTVYGKRVA